MSKTMIAMLGLVILLVNSTGCPTCPEPPPQEERAIRIVPGTYVATDLEPTEDSLVPTSEVFVTVTTDDMVRFEYLDAEGRQVVKTYRVAQEELWFRTL